MRSRRPLLMLCLSLLLLGLSSPAPGGEIRPRSPVRENPYFPLHVGDRWVYQYTEHLTLDPDPGSSIRAMTVVSVTDSVEGADGYTYFSVENFFAPDEPVGTRRLVRSPLGGSVVERDAGGGPSHLWYMLLAPVGSSWTLTLGEDPPNQCLNLARIRVASRNDSVRVPAGEFHNVVRLEFDGGCADAGIASEWYAPGVGLIKRRRSGLAGSVDEELSWASIRDRLFPGRPYTSTLTIDRPYYTNDLFPVIGPPGPGGIAVVHAALVLGNGSNVPATFEFDGCKSATFRILNGAGNEVLKVRGDDGGCCGCGETTSFTLLQNTLILRAGIRLAHPDGTRLPDGKYAVVAELDAVNLDPPLRPSAKTAFQIVTLQ